MRGNIAIVFHFLIFHCLFPLIYGIKFKSQWKTLHIFVFHPPNFDLYETNKISFYVTNF